MSTKQATSKKAASKKTTTPVAAPVAAAPAKKASKKVEEPVEEETQTPRVRREVTKESVDTDFGALLERIEGEVTRLRESSDKVKVRGIKFLRSVSKSLKTLHNDAKRVMKLKKKNARRAGAASGFLKPIRISAELAAFTGWDVNSQYSRVDVTKFICKYVADHNLFDQNDKRLILVDDKLKNLLKYDPANPPKDKDGNPALLNYFRLQKYLKNHFVRIDGTATPAPAASAPAPVVKKAAAAPKAASKKGKKAAPADDDADVEDA